jgi:hypothetical protein
MKIQKVDKSGQKLLILKKYYEAPEPLISSFRSMEAFCMYLAFERLFFF